MGKPERIGSGGERVATGLGAKALGGLFRWGEGDMVAEAGRYGGWER